MGDATHSERTTKQKFVRFMFCGFYKFTRLWEVLIVMIIESLKNTNRNLKLIWYDAGDYQL